MKLYNLFVAAALTLASFYSHAGAGAHGGEIVDIDGEYFPRDIVEQAKCETYKTGSEMIDLVPETKALFKSLSKVDWYFAMDLERELRTLSFCYTGPLKPIKVNNRNVPQIPTDLPSIFTGIRHDDNVLLDNAHFFSKHLKGDYRALFLVHETIHSYISEDMDPAARRLAVFTVVNAIDNIRRGALTSRETLHLIMQKSKVDFPTTVSELDPYRTQIEFILGDSNKKREIVDSATDLDSFVRGDYASMAPYVAAWDQSDIQISQAGALTNAYEAVLLTGSEKEIQHALSDTVSHFVSPGLVALGEFSNLPREQRDKISKLDSIAPLFSQVLRHMTDSAAYLCDVDVCANPALQEWAGLTPSSAPVMVVELTKTKNVSSLEWRAVANAFLILAENNEWATLEQIAKDPVFIEAITLTQMKAAMLNLKAPVQREIIYGQNALKQLTAASIRRVFATFEANLDPGRASRVENFFPKINN